MNQQQLNIVITITIKDGMHDLVLSKLNQVFAKSRTIEGCISIAVHENLSNHNKLLIYETWASEELWRKYLMQPHITEFTEQSSSITEEWTVQKFKKCDI